jgi:hypothetical protein
LLSAIPIYRTDDATTLDGFPSPANDKGTIWPSRKPESRFFGEEIHEARPLLIQRFGVPVVTSNQATIGAAPCGRALDAGFSPYQRTCLNR